MKIKILYADEDEKSKKELDKFLVKIFEKYIHFLGDPDPGDNTINILNKQLNEANVIIALITVDFINTDILFEKTKEWHEKGKIIISIPLRHCPSEFTFIKDLACLPKEGVVLKDKESYSNDDAFTKIAKGIADLIPDLTKGQKQDIAKRIKVAIYLSKIRKAMVWVFISTIIYVFFMYVFLESTLIPSIENLQAYYIIIFLLSIISSYQISSSINSEQIKYKIKYWNHVFLFMLLVFIITGSLYQNQISNLKTCSVIYDSLGKERIIIIPSDPLAYANTAYGKMWKEKNLPQSELCKEIYNVGFLVSKIWDRSAIIKEENKIAFHLCILFFSFSILIFSCVKLFLIRSEMESYQ